MPFYDSYPCIGYYILTYPTNGKKKDVKKKRGGGALVTQYRPCPRDRLGGEKKSKIAVL